MDKIILINKDSKWANSSGVVAMTLEVIEERLDTRNETLQILLRDIGWVITPSAANSVSLETRTSEVFNLFLDAALEAYRDILRDWSKHPYRSGNYDYMRLFGNLKTLLILDPRSKVVLPDVGKLILSDQICWKASGWMVDLVLENIIAWLHAEGEEQLAQVLLEKWDEGKSRYDLSPLNKEQFQRVVAAAEKLGQGYTEIRIKLDGGEAMMPLAPRIIQFRRLCEEALPTR